MTHRQRTTRRRGFSLVEILVVIAIMGILVGLVVVGATQLRGNADISRARTMLGGLSGAATEYEVATGKPVLHMGNLPIDWSSPRPMNVPGSNDQDVIQGDGDTPEEREANLWIERFVSATYQMPTTRGAIDRAGSEFVVDEDGDGFLEVRDPWGNNIAYLAYSAGGRLPRHDSPFFASAGPDGRWGDIGPDGEPNADAADNLYSFDIER